MVDSLTISSSTLSNFANTLQGNTMFKIYANGSFVNEVLGYGNALSIARQSKACYGKGSKVTIEDIKGRIVDTF